MKVRACSGQTKSGTLWTLLLCKAPQNWLIFLGKGNTHYRAQLNLVSNYLMWCHLELLYSRTFVGNGCLYALRLSQLFRN